MQPKDFEEELIIIERRLKERDRKQKKIKDENSKFLETLPFSPRMRKILAEDNVRSPVSFFIHLLTNTCKVFSDFYILAHLFYLI